MWRNVLITAFRNVSRQSAYALTNVLGLSVGLAGCLLIMVFVRRELSIDVHHTKGDRIHRVISWNRESDGTIEYNDGTDAHPGPALKDRFPEVEQAVRVHKHWGPVISGEERIGGNFIVTEPHIFEVFDLEVISGDPNALQDPANVLISESFSRKLFGDSDPLGKTISVDERLVGGDYTIAGVLKDFPDASSWPLYFEMVTTRRNPHPVMQGSWTEMLFSTSWRPLVTYVLLREGANREQVVTKMDNLPAQLFGEEWRDKAGYDLQPLPEVHLYSRERYGFPWGGDINNVYLFSSIAGFVLFIACINFVNLATARSSQRSKEVGVRKTLGASRSHLLPQFLGESVLLALVAGVCAILIATLSFSEFAQLVGRTTIGLTGDPLLWIGFVGLVLGVGVLAGLYPAMFLSGFRPIDVLAGNASPKSAKARLRNALVTFQFVISVVLIIATLVLRDQVAFMQSKDPGFDRDHVLSVNMMFRNPTLWGQQETIKNAFMRHPGVLKAAFTHQDPGIRPNEEGVIPEGLTEPIKMRMLNGDWDFLDLLRIEVVAGRYFQRGMSRDSTESFLLNETAVKSLGWTPETVIGKRFEWPFLERKGQIIGVVKDFNVASLHKPIEPAFIVFRWNKLGNLLFKIRPENVQETLDGLKETWSQFMPNHTFEPDFLDDEVAWLYRQEERMSDVFTIFFGLAIFIACLGLLALATFTAEQRTKEIGIRKSVGADDRTIVALLAKGFLKPVVSASLIGWPVAYWVMSDWLNDFAYRVSLGPVPFVGGAAIAILIAMVTVGYQAIRASRISPVEALRHE
jgi:putative ABC transport system permease protein